MKDNTMATELASVAHVGRRAPGTPGTATQYRSRSTEIDLDLLDVMLDLDPGMLAWTPPRTRVVSKGHIERAIADAPRRAR